MPKDMRALATYFDIVRCDSLDISNICGIINITKLAGRCLGVPGVSKARQQTLEGRCAPRRGHAEPGTREGARSKVPRERVLRSTRRRTSQIRVVAPCLRRERFSDGCFRRVRRLQADLLPSQGELRRGRNRGAGPQEARPTWPPQDPRRSTGVSQNAVGPWRADSRARVGEVDPRGTQHRCSSADNRTHIKKNAAITATAHERSNLPPTVVVRYEALRMAALGEALPPEARSGLTLFLRRGMWGWSRALAAGSPTHQPIYALSFSQLACCDPTPVIHILAAMAMNVPNRRVP